MQAGRLKYRLRIYEPCTESDRFGEPKPSWKPKAVVYAERVKLSGSQRVEASELFSDYRAEFNIRDAHRVGEGWRVEQIGGNLYNVVNIIPNKDRGMLTLVCERANT